MIITASPNSQRIPTLLGLAGVFALVVAVAVTVRGAGQITKFFPQAESPSAPASVGVVEISDTGASVYWATDKDTAGSVFYGKSSGLGDGVAVDDRDLSSQNNKYSAHLVRISKLQPQTKYYFKIGVGSQTFGDPARSNNPYEFTTGPTLTSAPVVDPIFGKVLDPASVPAPGALVIWESSGAEKIVALTKTDGSYVLPIGNSRTSDLSSYLSPTDGLSETININPGGSNQTATVSCKVGKDRPLPTVKFGDTVNCSGQTAKTSGFKPPLTSQSASPSAGTLTVNVTDGQAFSTPLPTFSGKAGPNQIVQIIVRSNTPYSGTVSAGPDGSWSWTPPVNLSAGQHTVTITVVNPDSTTQVITRTFTVASGVSILPITSGTPSAQLTHLTCVGSTCSVVAGVGPNGCNTDTDCVATPSPAPVIVVPPPAPPRTPPATGSTENTLILLTLGLLFGTLGIVMVPK